MDTVWFVTRDSALLYIVLLGTQRTASLISTLFSCHLMEYQLFQWRPLTSRQPEFIESDLPPGASSVLKPEIRNLEVKLELKLILKFWIDTESLKEYEI